MFVASGARIKCRSGKSFVQLTLPPEAEEVALAWSKFEKRATLTTTALEKARINFWKDFLAMLPGDTRSAIQDKRCEFGTIESAHQKMATPKSTSHVSTAKVDGVEVAIQGGVPPAGIFVGRGAYNTLTGRVRRRMVPEDITLNIGRGAPTPPTPMPGHRWGKIVHDKNADWLAKWRCPVTGKIKYVRLAPEGRMVRTQEKFMLVEKLLPQLDRIVATNDKNLAVRDAKVRQLATCVALMLKLGIRLGNASSQNVFGVSTLQVRHVTYHARTATLSISFIGKDGVPYTKSVPCPRERLCSNLATFMRNKWSTDRIFEQITPRNVEEYVATLAEGLTPKVIRTILANKLFQQKLDEIKARNVPGREAIAMYKEALIDVADFCNHRTGVGFAKLSTITSQANYLDPRLTFRFAKELGIPPEKLMSKKMLQKFAWAQAP